MDLHSTFHYVVSGSISAFSTFIAYFYGDMNTLVITTIAFIIIDYVTGILVAISKKQLSSEVGFKGLAKKCWILIMIGVGNLLDKALNTGGVIKTLVCSFYIANEGISILENGHNLGIPIPKKVLKVLKTIREKAESEEENIELEDKNNGV